MVAVIRVHGFLAQKAGEIRGATRNRELAATVLAIHDDRFLEWFRRSATLEAPELVGALRSTLLAGAALQRG
jgi:hypothetical protein